MPLPLRAQLDKFLQSFDEISLDSESSERVLQQCLLWIRTLPYDISEEDRNEFKTRVRSSFKLTSERLEDLIGTDGSNGRAYILPSITEVENNLRDIFSRPGFIQRYVEYTECCEAPLAYHAFCALSGIGAVVNRRVWLDMGVFKLYPATGIIILGPSGIKKTSAADIITEILYELGTVKIYAEKLTPEALIETMIGDATGLVYAPELTVFLNRQKYNEGLVNLLTRFMDCPSRWTSGTIMRKERKLENVGISLLMCSALEYFIPDVPPEAIKGGFLPRNIVVLQEDCDRVIPKPKPLDPDARKHLIEELALIHANVSGEMVLSKEADDAHEHWYRTSLQYEKRHLEHEMMGPFLNRKDGHILRTAMILHASDCRTQSLCGNCYERSIKLISWAYQSLPHLFQQMFRTQSGEEQEVVLKVIQQYGTIKHYQLTAKLSYKFEAERIRKIVQSLKEQRLVQEFNDNVQGHGYKVWSEQ